MEAKKDVDAFKRFMKIVTGSMLRKEAEPDPDDVRISELEREVRALQRAHKRTTRRKLNVASQRNTAR